MGREARRVHPDWQHPTRTGLVPTTPSDWCGRNKLRFEALHEYADYKPYLRYYNEDYAFTNDGEAVEDKEDYNPPGPHDFMPNWTPEEATHWQMYETCSEGTPISEVCESPEALAQWCVDNKASTFAYENYQDYDTWMRIILGADAYMVIRGGVMGVEVMG